MGITKFHAPYFVKWSDLKPGDIFEKCGRVYILTDDVYPSSLDHHGYYIVDLESGKMQRYFTNFTDKVSVIFEGALRISKPIERDVYK